MSQLVITEPRRAGAGADAADEPRAHVLICEADRSWVIELPLDGRVRIGRSPECELVLASTQISREHACLEMRLGHGTLVDLGAQNGTFVEGERLVGRRELLPGDVIAIGDASLVFHTTARAGMRRTVLAAAELRGELEREVERTRRFQRTAAILCLQVPADEPAYGDTVVHVLRLLPTVDVVGALAPGQLVVIAPELDLDEAGALAADLIAALGRTPPGIGLAMCPADGCDADSLLAAARAAASTARPGGVVAGREIVRRFEIGGTPVLVADPAMLQLFSLLERLAASEVPVLVTGETGTGKEVVAAALHAWSARANKRLVAVNCAALPEQLVESELFGYQRGAFSGAVTAKPGLIESADGGTLFLDEIGEIPLAIQAKLLRVLETRRVTRLGGLDEVAVDLRIVAATNRDLRADAAAGTFRSDLYYRLSGGTLVLPPLRERPRELAILAHEFLGQACRALGKSAMAIADDAMLELAAYAWPGNVRELHHVMDFVAATHDGRTLGAATLRARLHATPPAAAGASSPQPMRPIKDEIEELERTRMAEALARCNGVQARAAELIEMPLRTFVTKLKRYNLR